MYYFILSVFIFYLLYVFISTTLLFRIPSSDLELLDDSFYAKRFISSTESQDRVVLVQDCTDTVNALADLIQQSSSSLDLAFPFEADKKETSFLSALLIEAAERGVVVRLLVDGKTMMTSRHWKDICVSLTQSSTISIRFYEPYSWGLPWTWRNHLNEAFLIQDGKHAFVSSGLTADTTNNQDILIINPLPDSLETSSLYSLHAYFEHIWKHPYSKERTLTTLFSKRRTANQLIQLKKILRLEKEANPNRFDHPIEWISYSFPTSQVTFLHNPIERFLKTPTVWFQLSSLIGITKKQAFMETKAFNPTKQMSTFLSQTNDEHSQNDLLVNPTKGLRRNRYKHFLSSFHLFDYTKPNASVTANTYLIDDQLSITGTFDLTAKSAYYNTATLAVIHSPAFTVRMNEQLTKRFNSAQASYSSVLRTEPASLHTAITKKQ